MGEREILSGPFDSAVHYDNGNWYGGFSTEEDNGDEERLQ